MSRYKDYTRDEDEIILDYMRGVELRDINQRAAYISEKLLPHRSLDGVRKRWYKLVPQNDYQDEIKDVEDLWHKLTPRTRKRMRLRIPRLTTNYIDPRTGRRAE